MTLRLSEEAAPPSRHYCVIPISYEITEVFDVSVGVDGRHSLSQTPRSVPPYTKDYDIVPGQNPRDWARWYDTHNWSVLLAWIEDRAVGGATMALDAPDVRMIEGREDLAVLWDLRVHPDFRARGVGHFLFHASEDWARRRGAPGLLVETQNTNVPACRFYRRQGCKLIAVEPGVYSDFPEEARLLWLKATAG